MGYVYIITNETNGKQYVGKTVKSIEDRWLGHCNSARNGSHLLIHKAIRKYGEEAFTIKILCESDSEEFLFEQEKLWITRTGSLGNGYNLTSGGEGSSGLIYTDEARWKMGVSNRGKTLSEEHRRKISESGKGKKRAPFSEKHRANLSKAAKGKKLSKEHRENVSKGLKARYTIERKGNENE